MTPADLAGQPRSAVTLIRPQRGWAGLDLPGIWEFRELLLFLVWRDLKVRYKQTVLGAAWVIVQPLTTVALFSVIFGQFARLPSDGKPYFLFAYCALLPWNLFAGAVNRSGTSLVSSSHLISKVYFPRVLVPLSAALGGLVDFAISLALLLILLVCFGAAPGPEMLTLPLWSLLVLALGLAVGLGLAALNVRFRDVGYLIGFLLQVWMYASPIAYSASIVPEQWRWLYQLNPMVGPIQGFRWALLGESGPLGIPWVPAAVGTLLLLAGATIYFQRVERAFADII